MLGKFVLGISALVFIAYGAFCLVDPTMPVGYAGLSISNGDGYAETAAMYGGLQTGIGLFCLLGLLKPSYRRGALTLLAVAIGALALARLTGLLSSGMPVSIYTWGALGYETVTASLAAVALRRTAPVPTTP